MIFSSWLVQLAVAALAAAAIVILTPGVAIAALVGVLLLAACRVSVVIERRRLTRGLRRIRPPRR